MIKIQNQKAGFSVGIHQQEVSGTISNNLVTPDAPEMILGAGRSKKGKKYHMPVETVEDNRERGGTASTP